MPKPIRITKELILETAFEIAREKGFQELIITCSPQNIASRKIIESLPFIFIEEKAVPDFLQKDFEEDEKVKRIYKMKL